MVIMGIIKDSMSFGEAWEALTHGESVAFAYWEKGCRIVIIDGFICLSELGDHSVIRSWHPDPIEMMQDEWMTVE